MGLELHVDASRWRTHIAQVASGHNDLVPVIKGNGYGFGAATLARETARLDSSMVAVGLSSEAASIDHDTILVLNPWRPHHEPNTDSRLVHTVSRIDDLAPLAGRNPGARVVLEIATSMRRHGIDLAELAALTLPPGLTVLGFTIHLPLTGSPRVEAERILTGLDAAAPALGVPRVVFVSHVNAADESALRAHWLGWNIRSRIGTELWLGDRAALTVRATVEDVHTFARRTPIGYRGRTVSAGSTVLVVAGGTSHGIGLEAPRALTGMRDRAAILGRAGLESAGRVRSPFVIDGQAAWFVEPPHMQVSMIALPPRAAIPQVGESVSAQVRFTATTFDAVHLA